LKHSRGRFSNADGLQARSLRGAFDGGAVLPGFARLNAFARIEKLRRAALSMLSQSFDCTIMPSFDVLEYDETRVLAEIMRQRADRKHQDRKTA
jgi:hypothetical protein